MDCGSFFFKDGFNACEYTTKSIKAIYKEAEPTHVAAELSSCVTTIGAARLKQFAKSLEDPTDWEGLHQMLERFAKDGIENLCVDYIVKYKKRKKDPAIMTSQKPNGIELLEILDQEDLDSPTVQATKRRKVTHLVKF